MGTIVLAITPNTVPLWFMNPDAEQVGYGWAADLCANESQPCSRLYEQEDSQQVRRNYSSLSYGTHEAMS